MSEHERWRRRALTEMMMVHMAWFGSVLQLDGVGIERMRLWDWPKLRDIEFPEEGK